MEESLITSTFQDATCDSLSHSQSTAMTHQQVPGLQLGDAFLDLPQFQDGELLSLDTEFMQDLVTNNSMQESMDAFTPMLNLSEVYFVDNYSASAPNNTFEFQIGLPPNSTARSRSLSSEAFEFDAALPSPVPDSSIASPISAFQDLEPPSDELHIIQSPSNWAPEQGKSGNSIQFFGTKPEAVIPWVQMVNTLLSDYKTHERALRTCYSPRLSTEDRILAGDLLNDILRDRVDYIAIWAYDAAADSARKRKNTRLLNHQALSSSTILSTCDEQTPRVGVRDLIYDTEKSYLSAILTSQSSTLELPHGSRCSIRLYRKQGSDANSEINPPSSISILAVPSVTVGLEAAAQVTFHLKSPNIPLYTTIQTFNVVPLDSAVIECISIGGWGWFKRLIEDKKASPTDRDPRGYSLLPVSL